MHYKFERKVIYGVINKASFYNNSSSFLLFDQIVLKHWKTSARQMLQNPVDIRWVQHFKLN